MRSGALSDPPRAWLILRRDMGHRLRKRGQALGTRRHLVAPAYFAGLMTSWPQAPSRSFSDARSLSGANATPRSAGTRALGVSLQAEANSDPAHYGDDEIDAEEEAKNVEARHRPMRENDKAEQQRYDARNCHPDPGHFFLHAERQHDPHDARGEQREAEYQRQHRCGQKRIFECDKAGDDVEGAEQEPKEKFSPSLDLKCIEDFGHTGNQHHHADDEHAHYRGEDNAAERNPPGDDINDAKGDDPARFGAQRCSSCRLSDV